MRRWWPIFRPYRFFLVLIALDLVILAVRPVTGLMMRFVGEKSGAVGAIISLLLGALAAGPLYGAFPVAATMLRKDAKFQNVMILLYSWSTLKLPMFLFETSALGARFSVTRLLLDIPGTLILAWLTARLMRADEKLSIYRKHQTQPS